ncbi:MAG: hypothetical protein AB7S42_06550 [Lysobacteraceae bacterium]|jgi:hypothetical protein
MIRFFPVLFLVLMAWLGIASSAHAQTATPLSPKAAAQFQREMRRHVGDVLPAGLMVKSRQGQDVDLRDALGSRTILFKLDPECEPCLEFMDFLRKHRPKDDQVTIVVLMVKDTGTTIPDLPPQVIYLRTALDMRSEGFLAGEYTPTTFYFDEASTLIKREVGAPFSLENLLQFPTDIPATP